MRTIRMETRPPAFSWYPKDFEADEGSACMTLAERGAYITLLGFCWMEGSIPDDLGKLARLCRCSYGEMKQVWPALEIRFGVRVAPGRLSDRRIEQERAKLDQRSKAARESATTRWQNAHGAAVDTRMQANARGVRARETPACEERARGDDHASANAERTHFSPSSTSICSSQTVQSSSSSSTSMQSQVADWLQEAAQELTRKEWRRPDAEIAGRILNAARGDLEALGDYLGALVREGRKDVRSYGWFETVISKHFSGGNNAVA